MKHNLTLTITSLLSILFMTFHLADDTLHAKVGTAQAGGSTLVAVPILVGCTERWCLPNGGLGTFSSSSGLSLGRARLSFPASEHEALFSARPPSPAQASSYAC